MQRDFGIHRRTDLVHLSEPMPFSLQLQKIANVNTTHVPLLPFVQGQGFGVLFRKAHRLWGGTLLSQQRITSSSTSQIPTPTSNAFSAINRGL